MPSMRPHAHKTPRCGLLLLGVVNIQRQQLRRMLLRQGNRLRQRRIVVQAEVAALTRAVEGWLTQQ